MSDPVSDATSVYDAAVRRIIQQAMQRLKQDVLRLLPQTGGQVLAWMGNLSQSEQAEDRLMGPDMFPVLLLPWWVARAAPDAPDEGFHIDLAYASISAYYFVRLVDNVMDDEVSTELEILPASAFFQRQAAKVLYQYFAPAHPFWQHHDWYWYASAERAMTDAGLEHIDQATFETISAQKVCAAQIPLAAACYWYSQADRLPDWARFCNTLGCYHQMFDDISDWMQDEARTANTTYLLSEAQRRSRPEESMLAWLAREGFAWSTGLLQGYLDTLQNEAAHLGAPEVVAYLNLKADRLQDWTQTLDEAFVALEALQSMFNAD